MYKKYRKLSDIFNRKFFYEILNDSNNAERFIKENFKELCKVDVTYGKLYEDAYNILKNEYRCEYVYKNAIIQKKFLGTNSLNSAVVFEELVIDNCKADLVIINSKSTVYEIKTELDSLKRLNRQLDTYMNVFEYTYVVTYEKNINSVLKVIPENVGVIILTEKYTLKTIKKAKSNLNNIKSSNMFDMLRKKEYLNIIQKVYKKIPDVPNTKIYSVSKQLFERIPSERAHKMMINELKKRKLKDYQKEFLNEVPLSLKVIGVENKITKIECDKIKKFLSTSIN